jgi:hypothetical protein
MNDPIAEGIDSTSREEPYDMTKDMWVGLVLMCFFVLATFLCWAAQRHSEAVQWERLTGEHVTTWDAMFLELRTRQPKPKQENHEQGKHERGPSGPDRPGQIDPSTAP